MKKAFFIIMAIAACAALIACTAGAENSDLTSRYLPEGAEFVRSERDDGFTEYKYRGADGGSYTLLVDSSDAVRALEYDSNGKSTATEAVITADEAFAIITAQRPEAVQVSAVQDRNDGRIEWDIMFIDGNEVGFYELDAATGDVLEYDIFYSKGTPVDPAAIIGAQISGAVITEISIDSDDGRIVYDGEADSPSGRLEFTIDADTGTVVELEYDD